VNSEPISFNTMILKVVTCPMGELTEQGMANRQQKIFTEVQVVHHGVSILPLHQPMVSRVYKKPLFKYISPEMGLVGIPGQKIGVYGNNFPPLQTGIYLALGRKAQHPSRVPSSYVYEEGLDDPEVAARRTNWNQFAGSCDWQSSHMLLCNLPEVVDRNGGLYPVYVSFNGRVQGGFPMDPRDPASEYYKRPTGLMSAKAVEIMKKGIGWKYDMDDPRVSRYPEGNSFRYTGLTIDMNAQPKLNSIYYVGNNFINMRLTSGEDNMNTNRFFYSPFHGISCYRGTQQLVTKIMASPWIVECLMPSLPNPAAATIFRRKQRDTLYNNTKTCFKNRVLKPVILIMSERV
jgi:hypothetical protein